MSRSSCAPSVPLYNLGPSTASLRERVIRGLRQSEKELPACLFYDARGVRIFEQLCQAPEYYFDRTERALLRRHVSEIGDCVGGRCLLVEYGSGLCRTTQVLLAHLPRMAAFVPVDRSMAQLKRGLRRLARRAPELAVLPIRADFTARFALPRSEKRPSRTIVYVAAATLATLAPAQAVDVLRGIARLCGRRGGLLIGVDLNRDPGRLARAFDDRQGLTQALNLNALAHANRRFAGTFQPRRFLHYSFYNQARRRVEWHLLSQADQLVKVGGARIAIAKGESIRTECFYQYDLHELRRLAGSAGMSAGQCWHDDDRTLALQFYAAA